MTDPLRTIRIGTMVKAEPAPTEKEERGQVVALDSFRKR